jgi:hypothetical protein
MTEKLVEAIVGMREEEAIGLAREALEGRNGPHRGYGKLPPGCGGSWQNGMRRVNTFYPNLC